MTSAFDAHLQSVVARLNDRLGRIDAADHALLGDALALAALASAAASDAALAAERADAYARWFEACFGGAAGGATTPPRPPRGSAPGCGGSIGCVEGGPRGDCLMSTASAFSLA